ncbi:hypothetical protein Q3G72_031908 [Acer saccharum]|nr:hypothetical protein Q3G72_031908 [Acer saccharum]
MGLGDDLVKDCGAGVALVGRRKSEGRLSSARPAPTFCPSCAGVAPVTGAGRPAPVPASAPQLLPFGSNAPFVC